MHRISFICTCIMICCGIQVMAQSQDTIKVDEMEVLKSYRPEINTSQPIHINPVIEPAEKKVKAYDYEISTVPLELDIPATELKPLAMNADEPVPLKKFYAKLGYGTRGMATGDISYQILKADLIDLNIYGSYRGVDTQRDEGRVSSQTQHLAEAGLFGSWRLFDNTRLNYDLNVGYDDYVVERNIPSVMRDFSVLHSGLNFGFQNVDEPGNGINYNWKFQVNYLEDRETEDKESTFRTGIKLDKKIDENFSGIADLEVAYIRKYDLDTESTLTGGQVFLGAGYSDTHSYARLGIDLGYVDKIRPFPSIEVGYNIVEETIQLYGVVDQDIYDNTAYANYQVQPFHRALATADYALTIRKNYGIGSRGSLADKVAYSIEGGYEDVENGAELTIFHQSLVDYQGIYIHGDVSFRPLDYVSIGAAVQHKFFTDIDRPIFFGGQKQIGGLPNHIIEFRADVDIMKDKLKADVNYKLSSDNQVKYFSDIGSTIYEYSGYNDFNIELTYTPVEKLDIWLKANDIFDNQYEIAPFYQSPGRFVQGGIAVKF